MKIIIIDSGVSSEIARNIDRFSGMCFQRQEEKKIVEHNYEDRAWNIYM